MSECTDKDKGQDVEDAAIVRLVSRTPRWALTAGRVLLTPLGAL